MDHLKTLIEGKHKINSIGSERRKVWKIKLALLRAKSYGGE